MNSRNGSKSNGPYLIGFDVTQHDIQAPEVIAVHGIAKQQELFRARILGRLAANRERADGYRQRGTQSPTPIALNPETTRNRPARSTIARQRCNPKLRRLRMNPKLIDRAAPDATVMAPRHEQNAGSGDFGDARQWRGDSERQRDDVPASANRQSQSRAPYPKT